MSNTPAKVDSDQPVWTPPPPEPASDFGWLLLLGGAVFALLASWLLFPIDGPGMWAGYMGELAGIGAVVALAWARSTLPVAPAVGLGLLCGLGLILFTLLHLDEGIRTTIPLIASGALMAIGAGLMTTRSSAA